MGASIFRIRELGLAAAVILSLSLVFFMSNGAIVYADDGSESGAQAQTSQPQADSSEDGAQADSSNSSQETVKPAVTPNYQIKISGSKARKINCGSSYDLKAGVTAFEKNAKKDVTDSLVLSKLTRGGRSVSVSSFSTKTPGAYRVTYAVGSGKYRVSKSFAFTVVDKTTISNVEKNCTLAVNSSDAVQKVKATALSGDQTSKLSVKIKAPGTKKTKKYSYRQARSYKFTKPGQYKVTYQVVNSYPKKTVTKKATIAVTDKTVISGVKNKGFSIYVGESCAVAGVSATSNSKDLTKSIEVKITDPKGKSTLYSYDKAAQFSFDTAGVYKLTYSVTNPYPKKTVKESTTFEVNEETTITGAADQTQDLGVVDLTKGVSVKCHNGKDVTAGMTVVIAEPDGITTRTLKYEEAKSYQFTGRGKYVITYSARNPYPEKKVSKEVTWTIRDIADISAEDRTVEEGTTVDLMRGVKVETRYQDPAEELTEKIKVVVKEGKPDSQDRADGEADTNAAKTAGSDKDKSVDGDEEKSAVAEKENAEKENTVASDKDDVAKLTYKEAKEYKFDKAGTYTVTFIIEGDDCLGSAEKSIEITVTEAEKSTDSTDSQELRDDSSANSKSSRTTGTTAVKKVDTNTRPAED